MANSWNGPQLGSPIRTDVPELQKKLIALLKQDPTSVADIPSGAKRLVNTSGVQWQVQQYNGSSWAAIGKLMHDVDKLDGYHAAITPAASTIAVRNADKKLEGDITGNAATASSAATLSETLPVNKGGTGATTSAAARTNLGVPPTSHTSTGTTYGVGNATQYGHLKLSDATDSSSGVSGGVAATPAAVNAVMKKASTEATSSTSGIVMPGDGLDVVGGKMNVDSTVVRTSGEQNVGGVKTFTASVTVKNASLNVSNTPSETFWYTPFVFRDKNNVVPFNIQYAQYPTGENLLRFIVTGKSGGQDGILTLITKDGLSFFTGPTPADGDNSNKLATTAWVFNNSLPTGFIIPSFATSMARALLCNGAAVSRVTYKNLFDILGTSFGEGDGETTFNLPDFRGMTFSGAKGNLKAIIPAGLPEISGALSGVLAWNNFSASGAFSKTFNNYNTSGLGNQEFGSVSFDFKGSRSNGVYGKSNTVQPPAIAVNIFIKY